MTSIGGSWSSSKQPKGTRRLRAGPHEDGARAVRALNRLRPAIFYAVDRVRTGEIGRAQKGEREPRQPRRGEGRVLRNVLARNEIGHEPTAVRRHRDSATLVRERVGQA